VDNTLWTTDIVGKVVRWDRLARVRLTRDLAYPRQFDDYHCLYFGSGDNWDMALSIENVGGGLGQICELLKIGDVCNL
jgi:hypothetical protein